MARAMIGPGRCAFALCQGLLCAGAGAGVVDVLLPPVAVPGVVVAGGASLPGAGVSVLVGALVVVVTVLLRKP